jgi:hypothetical protein
MIRSCLGFLFLLSLSAFAQDVTVTLQPIEHPETARVLVVNGTVTNHAGREISNVTVLASLSPGPILAGQSDEVWSCRDNGSLRTVRCFASALGPGQSVPITFYIDALVGRFRVDAQVFDGSPVTTYGWFPHDIHVTHDGDSGEGSLRRAIVLANEDCEGLKVPCRIVFDDAMTIRPLSPLPPIWGADIAIDGGGRVTLDGSLVSGGSGLELVPQGYLGLVRGLTIRRFPWDGIHVSRESQTVIEDCTIEGNGSRGITGEAGSQLTVRRNRIHWNGRSGLFALGHATLAEENAVENNGASGVFATGYNTRIVRNRITENAHFGVAVPRGVGTLAISENSMSGNALAGIDRGLDGFDGYRYDDYTTHQAYIPPPRITEARYDAGTNTTTIRGTYFDARDHWGRWTVELFSNPRREPQGETFLGRTQAAGGEFTLTVPRDLRGQFVTATGFRELFLGWSGDWRWTTEFAEVVEVE